SGSWARYSPRVSPSQREGAAFATDGADRILTIGGFDRESRHTDDTWLFTAGEWQEVTPIIGTQPPKRWLAAMAYDSRRSRFVMTHGQLFSGAMSDVWEWTGSDWVAGAIGAMPARTQHVLIDDVAGGALVM